MSKHTPGPWDVKPDLIGYVEASIADDKGASISPIAVVFEHSEYGRSLPAKANTRLIAAAPDLLAALEHALEDILTLQDLFKVYAGADEDHGTSGINIEIAKAIAKAGGAE